MEIVFGDLSLGITHEGTRYIFAYDKGGLESLCKNGREYLYRTPNLAFWRASTDNDRGNGFASKSAIWMGADYFSRPENHFVTIDGTLLRWDDLIAPQNNALVDSPLREARDVSIRFVHSTATSPEAEVEVTYTLSEDREGLRVDYSYNGCEGLPELPICGLRFTLPFAVDSYEWDGLSGETYPDRMYGGKIGHYVQTGPLKCPYIRPQDYGMHMDTSALVIHKDEDVLTIRGTELGTFNFSLLPNSPHELEAAWHNIELPAYRRSYLTLAAAVRGVGGIDSWGSEPAPAFHLDASECYSMSFEII